MTIPRRPRSFTLAAGLSAALLYSASGVLSPQKVQLETVEIEFNETLVLRTRELLADQEVGLRAYRTHKPPMPDLVCVYSPRELVAIYSGKKELSPLAPTWSTSSILCETVKNAFEEKIKDRRHSLHQST